MNDILYEDDLIYIINKNSNQICNGDNTIFGIDTEADKFHRMGMIHRLDSSVSGCLAWAKSNLSQLLFTREFARRKVTKRYLAYVYTDKNIDIRTIDEKLYHNKIKYKTSVNKNGKEAVTKITWVKEITQGIFKLKIEIITGITHQIRAHLSYIGCKIIGDMKYGFENNSFVIDVWYKKFNRICLHAEYLEIPTYKIKCKSEEPSCVKLLKYLLTTFK